MLDVEGIGSTCIIIANLWLMLWVILPFNRNRQFCLWMALAHIFMAGGAWNLFG